MKSNFEPYSADNVTGQVLRWSAMPSALLEHPRDVLVWLPPGYDDDPERRYPVLYVHDGQNVFDPTTSFAGVDWGLDATATRLLAQYAIEPLIMVAIYNTPARMDEYNPLTLGPKFGQLLMTELMPVIDRDFRTRGGRCNAVMGSSMGGLISLALHWWYPETFFGAACLSSSLWVLRRAGGPSAWLGAHSGPRKPGRLYIDHGTSGPEARGASLVVETLQHLAKEGYDAPLLRYFVARGGEHNEASWGARADRPLKYLFGHECEQAQKRSVIHRRPSGRPARRAGVQPDVPSSRFTLCR